MNCSRLQLTASENQEIDFSEVILSGSCFLAISAACLISFTVDFDDSGISNFSNLCSSYLKLFVTFDNEFFVSQVSKLMFGLSVSVITRLWVNQNQFETLSKQTALQSSKLPGIGRKGLEYGCRTYLYRNKETRSPRTAG